jgi:probable HAF family extracellular repeat protein
VVVGLADTPGYQQAFSWTSSGGMVPLNGFNSPESRAFGVSADGSVVVGSQDYPGSAVLWTMQGNTITGMTDLALGTGTTRSTAFGVSADGKVAVGNLMPSMQITEAFRWTQATGTVGLGSLSGSVENNVGYSSATAASADGSVIVGTAVAAPGPNGPSERFRWTAAGGMQGLGFLPGTTQSAAYAVSADGSVVVGFSAGATEEAFIWTASGGMQSLQDVLAKYGLGSALASNDLGVASGISADGTTIVGNGAEGAWIITIPTPTPAACGLGFEPAPILLALLWLWNRMKRNSI